MRRKAKLITDKPASSGIYNDILGILDKLTGIKWGYVGGGRRVKYLSSAHVPAKIGITWGKSYEKNIKYKLDINIVNKTPKTFTSHEMWVDAITSELKLGLLNYLATKTDTISKDILMKVNAYSGGSKEYNIFLLEAETQNKKYGKIKSDDNSLWEQNCLRGGCA